MSASQTTEKIIWLADCYSLAKRFPDPVTWLALLHLKKRPTNADLNPFYYWLWMEIWKAAQNEQQVEAL
jgi:hypothetical protein